MEIVAPLSKYKKNNLKYIILILIGLAIWCVYDGYFNDDWIEKYTDAEGNPKAYLVFNRTAPPYLIGAAVILAIRLFVIRKRKLVVDENELVINNKKRIPCNTIQKIDKTNFKSKGSFSITYTDTSNKENKCKFSDRTYDNLEAILNHLVEKIS